MQVTTAAIDTRPAGCDRDGLEEDLVRLAGSRPQAVTQVVRAVGETSVGQVISADALA
jgi:hypothetical protein